MMGVETSMPPVAMNAALPGGAPPWRFDDVLIIKKGEIFYLKFLFFECKKNLTM
jgi:hypothetical protein